MARDILISFYVPTADTDAEALAEVEKVLPYDPDSDPRHGIESWVAVEPKVKIEWPPLEP